MIDLYTTALVREAEAAAKRRLGVPSERDVALLVRAGALPSARTLPAFVARGAHAAARGLERLAARLDRFGGLAVPASTSRLARR